MSASRREFLGKLAAAVAGVAGAGAASMPAPVQAAQPHGQPQDAAALPPSTLPARRLGRTGATLPVLALGGFHLGAAADEKAARTLVETALEEGVRFFDSAESYQDGRSERWLGAAIASLGVRKDVWLMTKTHSPADRSAESARRHLAGSLERLRTDRLDLWQLHAVASPEDVDRAFAVGGAMEYILEQQAAGVVRCVGVTGHADPAANLRALEHFDRGMRFDVMQLPINPIDAHTARSFQKQVLPALVERDLGVLAMKTNAGGALSKQAVCTVEECLRYALGLPVALVVSGMETPEQVRKNAATVRQPPLDEAQREGLLARIAGRAGDDLEWYKAK